MVHSLTSLVESFSTPTSAVGNREGRDEELSGNTGRNILISHISDSSSVISSVTKIKRERFVRGTKEIFF